MTRPRALADNPPILIAPGPFHLLSTDGEHFPLGRGRQILGSSPDADVRVKAAGIAEEHLVLTVTPDRVFCQARASGLSFTVNGKGGQSAVLRPGDDLGVGDRLLRLMRAEESSRDDLRPEDEVVHQKRHQSTVEDAYERLKLESSDEPQRRRLEVFYRLAVIMSCIDDPTRFYEGLLHLVHQVVPAGQAFFVLFDEDSAAPVVVASRSGQASVKGSGSVPSTSGQADPVAAPSSTILERVRRKGISLITRDAGQDPRLTSSESIHLHAIRRAICAPIRDGNQVLGALYADGRTEEQVFTDEDLTLLESIASFAGVALRREQLYQSLKDRELHAHLLVHDMKNPLAGIRGAMDLLRHQLKVSTAPREICLGTLALAERAAVQLDGYISDMLHAAQLEQRVLTPRRVEQRLADVLERLAQRWQGPLGLDERPFHPMAAPAHASFAFDAALMDRVLDNLVANALHYTPRGSPIAVHLTLTPEGLRGEVRDQGPGVPEAARKRIFEKYGRLAVETSGGRGFGLYFCSLAISAHGGHLWVEGEPGDNRFVFTLPRSARGT